VLPLGALAVRWLTVCLALRMNLAGAAGVEPAIAVLEAATVTVRSPLYVLAERRGLEPRRPEGPSAFEAASARPKLGLPLRMSKNHVQRKWSADPDSNWIRVGLQPTASTASAFGAWYPASDSNGECTRAPDSKSGGFASFPSRAEKLFRGMTGYRVVSTTNSARAAGGNNIN
jgi:hypothetical protein